LGCEVKLHLNTGNVNTDIIVLYELNIWLTRIGKRSINRFYFLDRIGDNLLQTRHSLHRMVS